MARARTSAHYIKERRTREGNVRKVGEGVEVDRFVVDRGHPNGAEIHVITSTGIIRVYNQRTNKLVTKLIARPGQIRRYYPNGNAPEYIIAAALEHRRAGLHEC